MIRLPWSRSKTRPEVLLHLGFNKTGTTTIQQALHGYRDARREYLPLAQSNHSRTLTLAFLDTAPPRNALATVLEGATEEDRARARSDLAAAMEASRRAAIVSGEYLSAFADPAACARTVDWFADRADHVRGLVYVRDPVGFTASAFQQRLRRFRVDTLAELFPEYRARIDPWIGALGHGNVEVALYDPSSFGNGGLLGDFARRAGMPEGVLTADRTANTSLSAEATALLYLFRNAAGDAPRAGPGARATLRFLDALRGFGATAFRLAPEALAAETAARADEIAWTEALIGRRFPSPGEVSGEVASLCVLTEYARTLGPEFDAWCSDLGVPRSGGGNDPAALMADLFAHCLAVETRA